MWFDSYNYVFSNYDIINSGQERYLNLVKRGILLDTAPLFILVVGHYDKVHKTNFIKKFQSKDKKGKSYDAFDYDFLLAFLNSLGLGRYNLLITPHIFTEFIKHLWEIVDNPEHFGRILGEFFKSKWYIKERSVDFNRLLETDYFLNKKLEIGDISIILLSLIYDENYKTILTDDQPFARISDGKFGFLTIYYNDIRMGTIELIADNRRIPNFLLEEPKNLL